MFKIVLSSSSSSSSTQNVGAGDAAADEDVDDKACVPEGPDNADSLLTTSPLPQVPTTPTGDGRVQFRFDLDPARGGKIVGKRGATVKRLQTTYNAQIAVPKKGR